MKKPKIFIACDTTNLNKIKRIIRETQNSKLPFGYKFGLEFLNSKSGRKFVANLKNKITFGDYKLADIPNTCASAIKAIKDLKLNYITIHISSGLKALLAILLLIVGIVIAYDTFFAEEIKNGTSIVGSSDLNFFSKFIKEFSEDMPFFYGLFSILFAVILGIAAAFIRRSISKFRKKYFDKTVKQTK